MPSAWPKRADATAAVVKALDADRELHAGWDQSTDKYGLFDLRAQRFVIHSDEDMAKTDWVALRAELILRAIEAAPRKATP